MCVCFRAMSSFFSNLRIGFLHIQKDFCEKNIYNSLNSIFFFEIARFLQQVLAGSLKTKKGLLKNSIFISSM